MDEFELELKQSFLEESAQSLDDSEQAFLTLETNPNDQDILNQIFRLAHNLKGTARAVGFGEVAEFTHKMENLILALKEGKIAVDENAVNVLLQCNDHLRHIITGLQDDIEATFDSSEILSQIEGVLSGESAGPAASTDEFREDQGIELEDNTPNASDFDEIVSEPVPDASAFEEPPLVSDPDSSDMPLTETPDASAFDFETTPSTMEIPTEVQEAQPQVTETPPPIADAPAPKQAPKKEEATKKKAASTNSKPEETLRVRISRLEALNNYVGELVILQSVLNEHRDDFKSPLLLKSLNQLSKISKEIHEMSMSLRMLPVKPTLMKLQRIVRDTSKALDKKVNLTLKGESTEVDKNVLESIAEPLVHITRNAIDHGLETPADRIIDGKSEAGNVEISCFHEGNNLVIEIIDDGKGINPKIIEKKAIEKGVIRQNSGLTDNELVNLIFHPGFSTKEQVSEVSGRGVGMDVVKTNITALSGTVRVDSKVGEGSVFRIELPLTMAVIEGLVTQVCDEKFVFPLSQITETLRPSKEAIDNTKGTGTVLNLRGNTVPIMSLQNILKLKGDTKTPQEQIAVIVKKNKKTFAVLVDDIHHQQQIVVKKLGTEVKNQQGYVGSSILGDGLPAIILDLFEITGANSASAERMAA